MSEFDNPAVLTAPSLPEFNGSAVATWGKPSIGAPADLTAANGLPLYDAGEAEAGLDAWSKFGAAWSAAHYAQQVDAASNGRSAALQDAIAERNKAIKQATGQDLEDPTRDGYLDEAVQRWWADTGRQGQPPTGEALHYFVQTNSSEEVAQIRAAQLQVYQDKLNALGQDYPDLVGDIRTEAQVRASKAVLDAQQTAAAAGPVGGFLAGLGGGLTGSWRDPLQMAALFLGGGEAKFTQSVAGQMFETFLRHGAVNAAVTAASEPEIAAWRAERGQDMSWQDAAFDMGVSFLFGGGLGAVGHLIGRAARGDGDAARQLVDRLKDEHAPDAAAELRPVLHAIEDDAKAAQGAPADLAPEAARTLVREHVRALEQEDAVAPVAPAAPAGDPNNLPAADFDTRVEARARTLDPVTFAKADALDNRIAAARQQLAELQEHQPTPILGQQRLAEAQAELAGITGKRRSSPRAKALRAEIEQLQQLGQTDVASQAGRNADTIQALRLSLNDAVNDRARLGPAVNAARKQALAEAEAMGFTRDEHAAARADVLPEAASRLLGEPEPPPDRGLDVVRETAPAAKPAAETVAPKSGPEGGQTAAPPKETGVSAVAPSDDMFPAHDLRAPEAKPEDILNGTPVERDGQLKVLNPGEAGAPNERVGFMAQLIENCVL